MKLSLQFGEYSPFVITWDNTIQEFPTLIMYKNSNYEFVMYWEDKTKIVDYDCVFGLVSPMHSGYYSTKSFVNIDDLILNTKTCECGKDKHGFAVHSRWCPKFPTDKNC